MNEDIKAAQEKLDDILKQQRDALQANNNLQLEKEGIEASILRVNKDKDTAQGILDGLNNDLDAINIDRSKKLEEIALLKTQISQAQSELETIKTANDKAVIDGKTTNDNIQASQDKILSDVKDSLKVVTDKKDQIEKDIPALTIRVKDLNDQVAPLEAKLKGINDSIVKSAQDLIDANAKVATALTSLSTLNSQNDEISRNIETATATLSTLTKSIDDKNKQIADINSQIATVVEILKTNNDQNTAFLNLRGGLIAGQQEVDQRLTFLKQKYGDIGEPW